MKPLTKSLDWLDDDNPVLRDLLGNVDGHQVAEHLIAALEEMSLGEPGECFFHSVGVGIALGLSFGDSQQILRTTASSFFLKIGGPN